MTASSPIRNLSILNRSSDRRLCGRSSLPGSNGRTFRHGRGRRRLAGTIGVAAAVITLAAGNTGVASAYSSSAVPGLGGAISYGFQCSANNNWVRQNWPNIFTATSSNVYVYVRSFLYRWNGNAWTVYRTGSWYTGVSNKTGQKQIGTVFGGSPYYFALSGQPSVVPPTTGIAFTNLPGGYYATREQYQVQGQTWSAWNYYQADTNDRSVSYCAA
jgi:hypothetical protein